MQADSKFIVVLSHGAGVCHVEVSIGSGPTSSIDVRFESEWIACGSDPHGCGEGFVPVIPDGGNGRLSLPTPICNAMLDAGTP